MRPVGGRAIASPTEPDELCAVFARDGVAMVRGAFDPDQAAAMRQQFWRFVERHTQIREHDPSSWRAESCSKSKWVDLSQLVVCLVSGTLPTG